MGRYGEEFGIYPSAPPVMRLYSEEEQVKRYAKQIRVLAQVKALGWIIPARSNVYHNERPNRSYRDDEERGIQYKGEPYASTKSETKNPK